jgi:acetylornithine deacetylase
MRLEAVIAAGLRPARREEIATRGGSHYGLHVRELDAVAILERLVAIDSTSTRSNLPIADFLCEILEPNAAEIVRDVSEDGEKCNLLILVGPETDAARRGLVLSGHMDAVPALEPSWSTPPFRLHDGGDRWVGRGTADMKGFLALAAVAARRFDRSAAVAPLVLLFTYDEEVGTLGARHWIDHQSSIPLPRATVIGEPTELRVVRMHKGHLKLTVRVHGRSAHSGYPHLGHNAIERAGRVVVALQSLREELDDERTDDSPHFEPVPWVPLNLGQIRGGTAINIVPDLCEIDLGVRLLPGMDATRMTRRIEQICRAATDDPESVSVALLNESPPLRLPENAPIHVELARLLGQTGTHAVSFATDAGWFQSLDLDCVLFGPGSIEVAHKADEFLPKDPFFRAGEILDRLIERFCMEAQ